MKCVTFYCKIWLLLALFFGSFNQGIAQTPDPYDPYYYEYSTVTFFLSVNSEGKLVGVAEKFKFKPGEDLNVRVEIDNNGQPFGCSLFHIQVFDSDIDFLEDEFNIKVQPDWDYVRFELNLETVGNYMIDVTNEYDTYINQGFFSVER